MKFVINGRTFDTGTSERLAIQRGTLDPDDMVGEGYAGAEHVRFEVALYRTLKGALFLHDRSTALYEDEGPMTIDEARECSPEQAVTWIQEVGAVVINERVFHCRPRRDPDHPSVPWK